MPPVRIAFLTTHPIQYQAPLFRRLEREPGIELKVFFCSDYSVRQFFDSGFNARIEWDVPLLDGYDSEVLPARRDWPRAPTFWQPANTGLYRRLKDGRFDWVIIHPYHRLFSYQAAILGRLAGARVAIRDEPTAISSVRSPLKRAAKSAFFAGYSRLIDRFLAIGTLNAAYWRALGVPDHKIAVMPYAVDNAFFAAHRDADVSQLRRSLDIPDGAPVILYASKLQARKYPDHLLEAFRRLPSGIARTPYLVFVGDGEMKEEIERRSAGMDTVRVLGFKGQQELPAYYRLCDVFILPSVRETWGLVVNEAMNLGKAIVVSDQVGCGADLVRNGENGYVFPAGDIDALSRALHDIVADPGRAARMGQRSLEIIGCWDFEADVQGLRRAIGLR